MMTTQCTVTPHILLPALKVDGTVFFVRLVATTGYPRRVSVPINAMYSATRHKTQNTSHSRRKPQDTEHGKQGTGQNPQHMKSETQHTRHRKHGETPQVTHNTPRTPRTTHPTRNTNTPTPRTQHNTTHITHAPSEREGGQSPLCPEILKQALPPRKPPLSYPHKRLPPQTHFLAPLPRVSWARA